MGTDYCTRQQAYYAGHLESTRQLDQIGRKVAHVAECEDREGFYDRRYGQEPQMLEDKAQGYTIDEAD